MTVLLTTAVVLLLPFLAISALLVLAERLQDRRERARTGRSPSPMPSIASWAPSPPDRAPAARRRLAVSMAVRSIGPPPWPPSCG